MWVSWSSGKDSAWLLHVLRGQGRPVTRLVTTVSQPEGRVAGHGVPVALLRAQARAVGASLREVELPEPCSNQDYEAALSEVLAEARHAGASLAFGDLFLEDVRAYREALVTRGGVAALFPLWQSDTRRLAREMVEAGLRAVVACVDPRRLPAELAGRPFDADFLDALPHGVDPCGERGEFHTFAVDGPMFREPVAARAEGVYMREGFAFARLHPAMGAAAP